MFKGKRILIVATDAHERHSFLGMVKEFGCDGGDVSTARTHGEARGYLKLGIKRPDAVLTTLSSEDGDALHLLRAIRTGALDDKVPRALPMCLITRSPPAALVQALAALDVNSIACPPLTYQLVRDRLAQALRTTKSARPAEEYQAVDLRAAYKIAGLSSDWPDSSPPIASERKPVEIAL